MRNYAAYIRVSTVRQGERGVSLIEQRSIIDAYAQRERLPITTWYEERETAAHVGRTVFRTMLRDLKRGRLHGLILHKIDRGARNLSDWAALSELADGGIDVRIAGDTLDLGSRGGRLSADIQAVVAADYIRNLREEVKKGQRGRLKQGFYPWAAPVGYCDAGGGKAKAIDPIRGPLVRRAFLAYATGNYSIRTLQTALNVWGLRTAGDKPLSRNAVHGMLRRPFYYGLIVVGTASYAGIHPPLVSRAVFDQVAAVLAGRVAPRSYERHTYLFRRMVACSTCSRHLYAETQKGHAYYRCHSEGCQGTCLRESVLLCEALQGMSAFPVTDTVIARYEELVAAKRTEIATEYTSTTALARLQLGKIEARIARLTDAFLDQAVDRATFDARKLALENERLHAHQLVENPTDRDAEFSRDADRCLELLKALQKLDGLAFGVEMAAVMKAAISNYTVRRKDVAITWSEDARVLFAEEPVLVGAPTHDSHRTFECIDRRLIALIEHLDSMKSSASWNERDRHTLA